MRLDKLLAHLNYGSRKIVKKLIRAGAVSVNGVIVTDDDFKVDIDDEVIFLDETVNYEEFVYLYFNKPQDVICANYSNEYATVFDYLPHEYLKRNFFTVGRLDKDTTGVLLITNDGSLAHRLLNPKFNIKKKYYVEFTGLLPANAVRLIEEGLVGTDLSFKPGKLTLIDDSSCYLEITEGKFHQVKNMFKILGVTVTKLKRVEFAGIKYKEEVREGEYLTLTTSEIEQLKSLVK